MTGIRRSPTPPGLALLGLLLGLGAASCKGAPEPEPPCTEDAHCREGERCTTEGQCVVGAECVRDEDCTAEDPRKLCNLTAFTCDFRDGFGDECDATRPCPFGEFCSTLLGRCLDAASARDCVRRSQCPANQICDREANKCIPDVGCWGDEFCEAGELCDLVNRTCRTLAIECTSCALTGSCDSGSSLCFVDTKECLAPGQEPACRSGESCDPLGRCVQCTNSSQCGPGLFCNVALGRCESNIQCVNDESECPTSSEVTCVTCRLPETCDARTRRCQAPPEICTSDLDCPNDRYCDLSLETPICTNRVPDCLNDLFDEPRNDTFQTAALLEASRGPLFDELKLCPGDQDWYRLDVAAGTYLTIDARFRHVDGDVELQLYLADGRTLVRESRSTTDNERVTLDVGTDLTLYLRVFLGRPTIRAVPYRLIVARDPGELCMDDGAEPNDTRDQASPLVSDVPFEGRICPADPDWFVLRNVSPGTRIDVSLRFTHSLGDLDLELYRADSPVPLLSAASLDDDERLGYDASYGGDYFIRVVGKRADTNVYTLRAELREGAVAACLDDPLEPNQGPATATSSSAIPRPTANLSICAGDEDWFRVHLEAGHALRAEIGFDPSADLDLRLYPSTVTDPRGTPLAVSDGISSREYVAYRARQAQDVLLRVHGHNPRQVSPYELRLDVDPPFFCQPDRFDAQGRGNDRNSAVPSPFPPFRVDDLTICSGDEDWYQIFIEGGFVNVLRLNYIVNDAELDYTLHDFNGNLLFSTAQLPRGESSKEVLINVPGAGFGILYVRVFSSSGFESRYNLTLDLTPMYDCWPDFAEPNDVQPMASAVTSSTISPVLVQNLTLCATVRNASTGFGDQDWFILRPPAVGARIEATIDFPQGDLSLELFSPDGQTRACANSGQDRCFSDGFDLTETVSFTAATTDAYFLKVSSVYSSPQVFVRPPDADTPYNLRVTYTLP